MKGFGILLLCSGFLLCFAGIGLGVAASAPSAAHWGKSEELREAERQLDFCRGIARDCSASEAQVEVLKGRESPGISALTWAYTMIASGPFLLILGTILFAAGKLEDIILAGRQADEAQP